MDIESMGKPDKFACPLPEVPHETKLRDISRRRLFVIWIIAFVLPVQLVRAIIALKKDARTSFWQAQTRRRVTPLEEMRAHKLIKDYIMRKRSGGSKMNLPDVENDKEPLPRWLAVFSITLILCFLAGGFTHKVLRATHELESGNEFFAIPMTFGCIPMLIAGGILAVLKLRVLDNMFWIATAALGPGMIALSFGYFVGYID